jgi:hypothetical protein
MKEAIQTKILEQLGDVAELGKQGIMKAVEVMQEQCPLLVEELLKWHMTVSLILFVVGVVILVTYAASIKKIYTALDKKCCSADTVGWTSVTSIVSLVIGIGLVTTNLTWLKIWIAPRLFLLEYVSELVK